MGLFSRAPYPGAYPPRGSRLRPLLLILGVALGLYFLNLSFLWIKIPAMATGTVKYFNIFTGILLIVLGIMSIIKRRY